MNADLAEMYSAAVMVARKCVVKIAKKNSFKVTQDYISEKSHDAATYLVEQVLKHGVEIKNFGAYVYLQTYKAMYGENQTKGRRFENFCVASGIDIFSLVPSERERAKLLFVDSEKKKEDG